MIDKAIKLTIPNLTMTIPDLTMTTPNLKMTIPNENIFQLTNFFVVSINVDSQFWLKQDKGGNKIKYF